jgi:hypothetical protein
VPSYAILGLPPIHPVPESVFIGKSATDACIPEAVLIDDMEKVIEKIKEMINTDITLFFIYRASNIIPQHWYTLILLRITIIRNKSRFIGRLMFLEHQEVNI